MTVSISTPSVDESLGTKLLLPVALALVAPVMVPREPHFAKHILRDGRSE